MIKYFATAAALKVLSFTPPMRRFYRILGNNIGGRRRGHGEIPGYYLERIKRTLRLAKQHGIVKNGDRILELGTGWLHWEALSLRLFFDIKAVLYDVWDNRQLGGLHNYMRQLRSALPTLGLTAAEVARASDLIGKILAVDNFTDLYALLDFEYVVAPDGSLKQFSDQSFNLVISAGVLEHVNRGAVPTLIAEMSRVLKPGGWAVHSIDTSDHLSHYDLSASRKKYLSYPEWTWKAFLENEVQYINRLQRSDWLAMFSEHKFTVAEEDSRRIDISDLRIAPPYAHIDRSDLACTVLKVALRK